MTELNDEDELIRCKTRMNEIALTRPGTLELATEYASLQNRVKQLELQKADSQREQRAYRILALDLVWDLRTEQVHVLIDASMKQSAAVIFSHAHSVREPEKSECRNIYL